jgi:hypothetical protein
MIKVNKNKTVILIIKLNEKYNPFKIVNFFNLKLY